ncbi:acylneuraminate cytidylyltransferase family protein [Algoriphagus sp. D3-2-R+10]|uniref:acylneuraminate cytidylyltransferase family protein n=1 Tax=Algoriphagus aurantiacus TaxID=3103948 RepID=UPI002B3FC12B|nr:acylneuraminate cytidylyltransferase family protein [Algoriphagus sp. D3-2-R+10]MEB2778415.1 acylneuraminate cytidylyltransferase family protein [Algoriphagus sp. D3-2-R+10]
MLVVIPARGGSKGLPGKNIKVLGGKPLIQHTIDAAKAVFKEDEIIISTDSEEIRKTVIDYGLHVPFLRPSELATDKAGTYEVLLHAIEFMENKGIYNDILVLLQPTSPFRKAEHIKEAFALYASDLDMVVSVKETKANPYYVLKEENEHGYLENSKSGNFITRQDCPPVWELNGAIYIINIKSLKKKTISNFIKVKKFVMNETSSHDIDTLLDWQIAELLYLKSQNGI